MQSIVTCIVLLVISLIVSAIVINFPSWKYYKEIYSDLPNKMFCINGNQVYTYNFRDGFTWFTYDNSFCLRPGVYLSNAGYIYSDPYSLYWLFKYKNWFKKNINIDKLPPFGLQHYKNNF